jgi:hypothetical protein
LDALGECYFRTENWPQRARKLSKAYSRLAGNEAIGYDPSFALMQAGEVEKAKHHVAPEHFRLAIPYSRIGDRTRAALESEILRQMKDRDRKSDTGQNGPARRTRRYLPEFVALRLAVGPYSQQRSRGYSR